MVKQENVQLGMLQEITVKVSIQQKRRDWMEHLIIDQSGSICTVLYKV